MKLKQCKPGVLASYRPHGYKSPFYCVVVEPPLQVGKCKFVTRVRSAGYNGFSPILTTVAVCALELVPPNGRPAVSSAKP